MDEYLEELNARSAITHMLKEHLDTLTKLGITVNILTKKIITQIVSDTLELYMDSDNKDGINIKLILHNKVMSILTEMGSLDIMRMVAIKDTLSNYIWSKYPELLNKLVVNILQDKFKYVNVKDCLTFTDTETVMVPLVLVKIVNTFLVDLFIAETLSRTKFVIKYPFETVHITQDNIEKHFKHLRKILNNGALIKKGR